MGLVETVIYIFMDYVNQNFLAQVITNRIAFDVINDYHLDNSSHAL